MMKKICRQKKGPFKGPFFSYLNKILKAWREMGGEAF